jgi:hydrogenase/urease accessory protein HupE
VKRSEPAPEPGRTPSAPGGSHEAPRRATAPATWGIALAALLTSLAPTAALAHQAGISYGTWTARGDGLGLELRLRAAELHAADPELAAGDATPADVPRLARTALSGISISQAGAACRPEPGPARWIAPDGVELSAAFHCPRPGEPMQVRLELLSRLPPGHVHLARVVAGGHTEERAADARRDGFEVAGRPGRLRQAAAFAALGVEHILTGWDHVAFLLGLLLATASLGEVARSLTSFTAAHALTLALATLGVARPPASLVEPLIAASVALVALENLRDLRRRPERARPRWPLALAFGLVHGFGFAGALDGLRLSGVELAVALGAFNAGVELGQAAIALAVYPLLAWIRVRPRLAVTGLHAASATVGAAGLFWLVQRLPW